MANKTLLFLFNTFCLPDYGIPLWERNKTFRSTIYKTFEVAYHKSLKRILGVPTYTSNHYVAETCNQFLFKHYIAFSQARFYKRLTVSTNPLLKLCLPWLKVGRHLNFNKSYFMEIID